MDAHKNEYAGAISGMSETYGRAAATTAAIPADGDFVSGVTAGKRWSGHVEWFSEDDNTLVINVGGGWLRVPVTDITH